MIECVSNFIQNTKHSEHVQVIIKNKHEVKYYQIQILIWCHKSMSSTLHQEQAKGLL